jgi:hypothetical protein
MNYILLIMSSDKFDKFDKFWDIPLVNYYYYLIPADWDDAREKLQYYQNKNGKKYWETPNIPDPSLETLALCSARRRLEIKANAEATLTAKGKPIEKAI